VALSYHAHKVSDYGASASSGDPYFDFNTIDTTGAGANISVTNITGGSISNANTNGGSGSGTWRMNIEILLNDTWYTIGYFIVYSQISTHQTFTSFVSTADASLMSLMGKVAASDMRGKVVAGYFHLNAGSDFYLNADTALDYTQCTPPTSVGVNATNVAPGGIVNLSWAGAAPGNGMSIDYYSVYRSVDGGATYELLQSVEETNVNVAAPTGNGASYLYKVQTVGTVAGYHSGLSTAYATLTCSFTAPTAPTVVTLNGAASVIAAPGTNLTLAFSGMANGTNNPITGYDIYRDGIFYTHTTGTSLSVPAHSSAGGAYGYTVYAIGTYSNSGVSPSAVVYSYGPMAAPASVSISANILNAGGQAVLSWPAAADGSYNAKTGYDIYRSTSAAGTYALLTSTTDTSVNVAASNTQGETYYYKVLTKGTYSNSALSSSYASLKTNTAPVTPTFVFPANGTTSYSTTPALKALVTEELDAQTQQLQLSIDGGSFTTIASLSRWGGTPIYAATLAAGNHTLTLRVKDSLGLTSGTASRSITVATPTWTRTIAAGVVISNGSISHRTDMTELLARINTARAFYGIAAVTFATALGVWANWKAQMQSLQTALAACFTAAGKTVPTWNTVPDHPGASGAAAMINQLRTQLTAC
jgi:fibronectin type 3 domain-containing protein